MRSVSLLSLILLLFVIPESSAEESPPIPRWKPDVILQTGFASTFQLTLGGTFGDGPAWQNRVTAEWPHRFRKGDAFVLNVWTTRDSPSHGTNATLGAGYRFPEWKRGAQQLASTLGWQRWIFPSVLGGTTDHLASANLVYRTRWKLPVTVIADDWVLLRSRLKRGNLLYVQGSVAHTLMRAGGLRLVLRHGPATTYSWQFYDRPGWRVLRYGGGLALEGSRWAFEASARQQSAIAPRIPDNLYWSFLLTRRM